MNILARLGAYAQLIRLEKPVGWLLLLWPTLWAVWLASADKPTWGTVGLFVGGVFVMRCFGCCLNDLADRKLDRQVARTRSRPLAAGTITIAEAIAIALVCLAAAFVLWLQLAGTARWWAVGALVIAATYPLAKRLVKIPQFHLGVAFSMSIPVAFAQLADHVPLSALLLIAANFCWIFAYDTVYAMVDREDDRRTGIYSSALWLGERDVSAIAWAYFAMLMLLLVHAVTIGAGFGYYLACGLGIGMAWRFCRMIRSRTPAACFRCFRDNHYLGMLIWLGLVADAGVGLG